MKGLTGTTWLLVAGIGLFYATVSPAADVLKQKVMGRWELDPERSHNLGGKSALVVDQYQRAGIRMFLEFRPDDTAITTMISPAGRQAASSKWQVVEENVRAITIELTDEKTKISSLGIGEFLSDDVVKMTTTIRGTPGAAPTMIYRRIR